MTISLFLDNFYHPGLGYSGIDNALSVEFDTYMNYENLDSFENHVSVLTQVSLAQLACCESLTV